GIGSAGSTASVTFLLVIGASSMIGSYTERFTVPQETKRLTVWSTRSPAAVERAAAHLKGLDNELVQCGY
ncbi:hypothetical protein PV371_38765, partial [Streptomyces sp. TX20-6-3]|uniref:hypothetical protein n=1 Tax=Streptomyces sp. TX20-6-3 TaxID=3028705 RepID=UPI0029B38701